MWWKYIIEDLARRHFLIYYRGGRRIFKHWPWSLEINDIFVKNVLDRKYERAVIYYPKCVNEEIFYPIHNVKKRFDILMVGDIKLSKGQWRMLHVLNAYKRLYPNQKLPSICMVGKIKDTYFFRLQYEYKLRGIIQYKGKVSRDQLRNYYNASKLYVHLGDNEQGSRTMLEAIRCGTPCMFSNIPHMWAEWQIQNNDFLKAVNHNDYEFIARTLYNMLQREYDRTVISKVYNKYANVKLTCKMWQHIVKIVQDASSLDKNIFINGFHITKAR